MRKKLTAILLSICVLSVFGQQAVYAENMLESGDILTDGTNVEDGAVTALAEQIVERTEEEVQKYQEEKAAAEEARIQEEQRRAEEARVAKRQEIVDFALQFEGNPYVWGGTSLTNGADCSGFVMSVFANFGYELPRVAASQYAASTHKDISDMETGDLVFYGPSASGIYHVALYIGDGKIIHASTSATGIKISDYDYERPLGIGTYVD